MAAINGPQPSIASLVGGLVTDIRDLFACELKVAKREIGEDAQKIKRALTALGIGLGILAMGSGLLLLMVVHLLQTFTPLPLWGCYGMVGLVVVIAGAAFLILAKSQAEGIDFTPDEAARAAREDIAWIRARVASNRSAREHAPLSVRR